MVAPRVRRVFGVDIDPSMVEAARWAAGRAGAANAEFHVADAETADLRALNQGRPYALATARLFFTIPLVARLALVLEPGGHLIAEALAGTHWHEAGGSRWNLSPRDVAEELRRQGMSVVDLVVEERVEELVDMRQTQEVLKRRRLWTKWKQDGRWETLRTGVRRGERTLTDSHFVLRAGRSRAAVA